MQSIVIRVPFYYMMYVLAVGGGLLQVIVFNSPINTRCALYRKHFGIFIFFGIVIAVVFNINQL